MKNVLIIYTGGTIGMTRTENGYAPQSGQFRRAMEAIPDLYAEQMPRWDCLLYTSPSPRDLSTSRMPSSA